VKAALVLAISGLSFFSFIQRVARPGSIFNDLQNALHRDAAAVTWLGTINLFEQSGFLRFSARKSFDKFLPGGAGRETVGA